MATLLDYLLTGATDAPVYRLHHAKGVLYRCDFCGVFEPSTLLLDVQGLPVSFRGDSRWACDGCRSTWQREHRPLTPGAEYLDHMEHHEHLARLCGIDTAHLPAVIAERLRRHEADVAAQIELAQGGLPGMDLQALQARLAKVRARRAGWQAGGGNARQH